MVNFGIRLNNQAPGVVVKMTNPPQLNIRVAAELKEAFIQKAKEDGTTAADLLVGFMKQYLEQESDRTTQGAVVDSGAIQTQISE